MKAPKLFRAAALALTAALVGASPALAGGGPSVPVLDKDWSFEGPFGRWDQAQLQRGWQVYSEVCSGCHALSYVHYRDLGEEGGGPKFPEWMVEAIAKEFEVTRLDTEGEEIRVPAEPKDRVVSPYANPAQATAINGAYPVDLSLIVKKRTGYKGIVTQILQGGGGTEYVYSLMLGYKEAPAGFDLPEGSHFNVYYSGHAIKMAPQLPDGRVEYMDGTEATTEQMAADIAAFLTWAAEPKMIERKRAGLANIAFLSIFAILLYFSTRKLWKPIKEGKDA